MPLIETHSDVDSNGAAIVENQTLRVVVLPELGGRIWSIVYKPRGRELLWHNPHFPPHRVPFGAEFDDVWCGGWEEMFPTAAPGLIDGKSYPDHGELWSLPWEVSSEATDETATLQLSTTTPLSAFRVEKRLTLRGAAPRLEVAYSLLNQSGREFPFLFALHPALEITSRCRLHFPPMSVELDPSFPGTLAEVRSPFAWPCAERPSGKTDLSVVQPESSREVCFLYGTNLQGGYCAVTDTAERLTRGLVFSPDVFRSCWLFATYGGWRNLNVALLEPSTSHPMAIEQVIRAGRAVALPNGGRFETRVLFQVQEGLSSVSGLDRSGNFIE